MNANKKIGLEQQLWNITHELKNKMSIDNLRDYILGFIFYKYLSDKQYAFAKKRLRKEDVKDYLQVKDKNTLDIIERTSMASCGYFLRPHELLCMIAKKGNIKPGNQPDSVHDNFIIDDLQRTLNAIEERVQGTESEDDFRGLFRDLDLHSVKLGHSPQERNQIITTMLSELDKIDFNLEAALESELSCADVDVLGDVYEYIIAKFAAAMGKKAGKFYTPQPIAKILAKLVTVDKKSLDRAYDPTCGSGSLLLRLAKEATVGQFFGQEINSTIHNLARMNMLLHGRHFARFDIQHGDTLTHPKHPQEKFDVIVANPPFAMKWKGEKDPNNKKDDRFRQYGALPSRANADFAFLMHMIYHLKDDGILAVILPSAALYRGPDQSIRKYMIEKQNYLDAVIVLPPKIFYDPSMKACVLIFKKQRQHTDNVFFINAKQYCQESNPRNIITDDHINKIISTYKKREDIPKYARAVPLTEFAGKDFSWRLSAYLETRESEKEIDEDEAFSEIKELDEGILVARKQAEQCLRDLPVPAEQRRFFS